MEVNFLYAKVKEGRGFWTKCFWVVVKSKVFLLYLWPFLFVYMFSSIKPISSHIPHTVLFLCMNKDVFIYLQHKVKV